MTDEAKEARREYYRRKRAELTPEQKEKRKQNWKRWRKNNPEKVKRYQRRSKEKKKLKLWAEWFPEYSDLFLNYDYDGKFLEILKANFNECCDVIIEQVKEFRGIT